MMNDTVEPTSFPLRPDGDAPDVAHNWLCPMCGAPTPILCKPGRPRVYCTNACRQRAYRWRRDNGIRLLITPWRPGARSHNRRMHAVRPDRDVAGRASDHRGRRVAICGAFAYQPKRTTVRHTEFVPGSPNACRSCMNLTGADPIWFEEYPAVSYDPEHRSWVYHPPAERAVAYAARRPERPRD